MKTDELYCIGLLYVKGDAEIYVTTMLLVFGLKAIFVYCVGLSI